MNSVSRQNYFDAREEETTPREMRNMAYNAIALAGIVALLLVVIAVLPFFI